MTSLTYEEGHQSLLKMLQQNLPSVHFKRPSQNPSPSSGSSDNWLVSKKGFMSLFPMELHESFHKKCQRRWLTKDDLTMRDIAEVFLSEFPDKGKRSRGHVFIPFYIALKDLSVSQGLPQYHNMTDAQMPRMEHTVAFGIMWHLERHRVIGLFLGTSKLFQASFNDTIGNITDRFYDIVFHYLRITIEVQEKGPNHSQSHNDKLKQDMAHHFGYRIKYFDGARFEREPSLYWNEFIEEVEQMVMEALIASGNPDIRNEFVMYEYDNIILEKILSNGQVMEAIQENVVLLESFLRMNQVYYHAQGSKDEGIIRTLFQAKCNKFLTMEEVAAVSRIPLDELIEDVDRMGIVDIFVHNDAKYERRMAWETLVLYLTTTSKCNPDQKIMINFYLSNVERIYKRMLQLYDSDTRERRHNHDASKDTLKEHILAVTYREREHEFEVLKKELEERDEDMNLIKGDMDRFASHSGSLIKNLKKLKMNAKHAASLDELDQIHTRLTDANRKYKHADLKIQLVWGESLFPQLEDFPLCFVGSPKFVLPRARVEAILNRFEIPKMKRNLLYKMLLMPMRTCKETIPVSNLEFVPFLGIRAEFRDMYRDDEVHAMKPWNVRDLTEVREGESEEDRRMRMSGRAQEMYAWGLRLLEKSKQRHLRAKPTESIATPSEVVHGDNPAENPEDLGSDVDFE